MGLLVIALISKTVTEDPDIWHYMDKRMYKVMLAFFKVLLGLCFWF